MRTSKEEIEYITEQRMRGKSLAEIANLLGKSVSYVNCRISSEVSEQIRNEKIEMKQLTFKQRKLVRIGEIQGFLRLSDAIDLYANYEHRKSALILLERKGFIKPSEIPEKWIFIKERKRDIEIKEVQKKLGEIKWNK